MNSSGHLDVPIAGDCAFCQYMRHERPYTILRERSLTATLVTREQRGVAHVLVLPIRHVTTILDLRPEESSELMGEIVEVARAIDRAEKRPGIAVWQNNGVPANQTIAHVHFHVAGTLPGGETERGPVTELPVSATEAIADRLRPYLLDLKSP